MYIKEFNWNKYLRIRDCMDGQKARSSARSECERGAAIGIEVKGDVTRTKKRVFRS